MIEDKNQPVVPNSSGYMRDALAVLGVSLIGYGAWLVYPPAGFIGPGVILTGIAIFGVKS
ncbi:hypothetical protein HKX54_02315 [Sulfitobacter sp. M57]|uniref:hypothetical protein n=1 Tax=unclassified Sulfitobacter TaxID=196795 RepID=UPI0023E2C35E|nr:MULTISPECIES: hypothetical protein [unclassified Sulfitobacter]MDF3413277.1 hypothetical protein [Sulfitobacter sp. KE5]MDF3421443.1 hypothetical protein [Sulfitobacter sp. KE43]MDF3431824.1 hypothetical protein [Sulfitobacter sp. KE42]MDF3457464.1 hypothetical protein [Sulfitobacter sp. S74]MDF3461366.1 hypothetical protein [Sulfitobacter sp. Ks18]